MDNKHTIDSLCFDLNSLLKNEFDLLLVKEKINELVVYLEKNNSHVFKNSQYLSLIKKISKIKDLNNELEKVFFNILLVNENIKEKNKYEIFRMVALNNPKVFKKHFLKYTTKTLYEIISYENKNNLKHTDYLNVLYSVLKIKARNQNKKEQLENFYEKFCFQKDIGFLNLKLYILKKILKNKLTKQEIEYLFVAITNYKDLNLIRTILKIKTIPENLIIQVILNEIYEDGSQLLMSFLLQKEEYLSIVKEKIKILSKYLSLEGLEELKNKSNAKVKGVILAEVQELFLQIIEMTILEKKLKNF